METNKEEENAIEREGIKIDKIVYVIFLGFASSSTLYRQYKKKEKKEMFPILFFVFIVGGVWLHTPLVVVGRGDNLPPLILHFQNFSAISID